MNDDPERGTTTGTASTSKLLAEETFREPSIIGHFAQNGRKRYLEWLRNRQEIANWSERDDANKRDDVSSVDGLHQSYFTTSETFPSKYLVDSDDEGNEKPHEHLKSTPQQDGKKKNWRKSVLFPTKRSNTKDDEESIVPPNASGIVSVMGRRVHADRLVQESSSLYSMLRAWVQGDPERTSRPPAAAGISVPRKTLSDYVLYSTDSSKRPKQNDSMETPPRSVDILGWLSMDPDRRPCTPCYPTMEEIRELRQKRTNRIASKRLRKQRLAAAKESLRRKGIKL